MFSRRIGEDAELRLLEEHHAEEVAAVVASDRARLAEWLPWPSTSTPDSHRAYIRKSLEGFARGSGFQCSIVWRGRIVGGFGLHEINPLSRSTSIGYWLVKEAEGRGLATAACKAGLAYAFDERGLNRVEIHCAPGNARSRAVPERLGFKEEGTLREVAQVDGRPLDLVIYGLLAREWRELRARGAL